MRKTLFAVSLSLAALAAASTTASAQPVNDPAVAAPAVAAVTGTVVGLGFSEGWWTAGGGALATTAGAAAAGALAGIGTLVFLESISKPCHGLRIFVDTREECAALMGPPPRHMARRYR
jgi:uncharacterized protein YcfJ